MGKSKSSNCSTTRRPRRPTLGPISTRTTASNQSQFFTCLRLNPHAMPLERRLPHDFWQLLPPLRRDPNQRRHPLPSLYPTMQTLLFNRPIQPSLSAPRINRRIAESVVAPAGRRLCVQRQWFRLSLPDLARVLRGKHACRPASNHAPTFTQFRPNRLHSFLFRHAPHQSPSLS